MASSVRAKASAAVDEIGDVQPVLERGASQAAGDRCAKALLECAARSTPLVAARSLRPAATSRPVVAVSWIAFAQVLLEIGEPAPDVPTQPLLGEEPQVGRGVFANPVTVEELTTCPGCA